jgi:acyl transferase domain-containing protein/NADPH:quinone reductase-like Zn-dependent oxidoreductase/aryl carrier-like protein
MEQVKGTRTSVYVGSFSNDYNTMIGMDRKMYPKYTIIGCGNSIMSNRISYFFDLHGPSMTVDTACSSSLVCFHLGDKSLQHNEADIAIVAGSALNFDPTIWITMADLGMLSSDGRSRTFDADRSGFARGEGVAAMILKRRRDALAASDNIRAVIRGTGSNHDGTKAGLTVPNGTAQADLIKQTYAKAGLDLSDTDYFESHGTGTGVGDPIEANTIGSVFAPVRDRPLYVGSIKSNLGHLEGAAGLAGVIKATMAIEAGKILPNMLFNKPNPEIDFAALKIAVPTEVMDWKSATGLRRASVNSFGYGGSNAHVILENHRLEGTTAAMHPGFQDTDEVVGVEKRQNPGIDRPYLIPLTSHNTKGAANLLSHLSDYIKESEGLDISDLAHSYSVRRSMHQRRWFVVGSNIDSVVNSLEKPLPADKWSRKNDAQPRIGFVFTGQGAQWYAMGRELLEKSPLFRQTIERCDAVLKELPDRPDWTCLGELQKSVEETRLTQSLFSQPLCVALQLAIVEHLRAWGIVPSAVVGHSSGEIVAAYAAGILSFENAIICAYYRGMYMSHGVQSASPKKGAMIAVGLTEAEGNAELAPYVGRIALAAVNSPSSLTLSGDEDAILELKQNLDKRKIFVRRLFVEQAFHSHHMDPLAPGFECALRRTPGFKPMPANVKFFSSVTARDSGARKLDASYWAANMTGVVRFADALTGILLNDDDDQNVDVLVEIGPHPALRGPSKEVVKSRKLDIPYFGTLTRDQPAFEALLKTAGDLFCIGYPVELAAVNSHLSLSPSGVVQRIVPGTLLPSLPSYSWSYGTYWATTRLIRECQHPQHRHTLLGTPMPGQPHKHPRWRSFLRISEVPWLSQHIVDGRIVFPAAAYVTMALEAVASTTQGQDVKEYQMRDVAFKAALILTSDDTGVEVIFDLHPLATSAKSVSSSWYRFSVCSFDNTDRMLEHCHGLVCAKPGEPQILKTLAPQNRATAWQARTDRRTKNDVYYSRLQRIGLDYGESFRLLKGQVEGGDGFSIARLVFDPAKVVSNPEDACVVHPTLLDASFHAIFAAIETCDGQMQETFVPTFIRSATFSGAMGQRKHSSEPGHFWVKSDTKLPGKRVAINHLSIEAETSGDLLIDLDGLELTVLGNDSGNKEARRDLFFRGRWLPAFSQLGSATSIPAFSNLGELMDVFAHQYPDTAILHVTSREDSVREVLRSLGGVGMKRRRFGSITPFSSFQASPDQWKKLQSEWPVLVNLEEPIEGQYDLVVLDKVPSDNVTKFLKPGGFVLVDNIAFETENLKHVFDTKKYRCWQYIEIQTDSAPLTILLSKNPSTLAQSVARIVTDAYPGKVEIATFTTSPISTTNVLSLVSLDEEVFYFQSPENEAANLKALQDLFNGFCTNVVWLLCGATNDTVQPSLSLMAGLLRTLRSEVPEARIVTLDLDATVKDARYIASRAVESLTQCLTEDELSDRNGRLLIPRIETDDARNEKLPMPGNRQPSLQPLRDGRNLALKIGKTGLLDSLVFEDDEQSANPELAPGDIEIEVRASALNFRDIAASMGIIDDYKLGDEAAGVVLRTGSQITPDSFRPGDRVLVSRPGQGAHRTIIRAPSYSCIKIGDMDFVTASLISGALCTAYYSLVNVARLQPGEWCLIHSAAGGVGQMAIQVAQMVGANVIATVGTQEKRDFLKEQFGLRDEVIFSSRDLSFVEGVMTITGGRGCDVALNSLAGDLLHGTWKCIARFGRHVEIGKRDIHENTKLDMEPFRLNITYASVDMISIYLYDVPLFAKILEIGYRLICDKKIRPPSPIRIFRYGEAQKAFRLLQMGKFFGKVVLVPEDDETVPVMPPAYRDIPIFCANKSYLLVGGLGGIGRSVAEWMFRKGARELAFLSRSGAGTEESRETIDWLKSKGVSVPIFQGDVANYATVESCIQALGHNLGGIFQAVMVLHDVAFANMAIEQWRACVYPKLHGTYNLHKATESLDLDFFVCFSSGASLLGSLGQANYVAANTYMDALMRHRRENGLCGTSMAVGVVDDVGVVAEDSNLSLVLDRLGYDSITRDEMFYQIEEAVLSSKGFSKADEGIDYHLIGTGVNMRRKNLYWAKKPLFRNLYANLDLDADHGASKSTKNLVAVLKAAADVEERALVLREAFIEKVAQVLGTPVESIHPKNPLSAYGLDSIVAVEFRKWFAQTIAVEIPLFDILGATSIEALTLKAAEGIRLESEATEEDRNTTFMSQDILVQKLKASTIPLSVFESIERPKNVPLSSNQGRMWFLHNFLSDPSSLNWVVTHHIAGKLRLDIAQKALVELVRRNGVLRTRYFEGDEHAQQELLDECKVNIFFEDLTSTTNPEESLQDSVTRLQKLPINITEGESMRVMISKLGVTSYVLTFVLHHIACDGGSAGSIVSQLVPLYEAFAEEKDISSIPAPRVGYMDFSIWQNQLMESSEVRDDIGWWRKTLDGAPSVSSLLPFANGCRQIGNGERRIVAGSMKLSQVKRMKRLASQANATLVNFVTAAFRAFHYRYTEDDDLTILMIDGSRPHSELDNVVGFFVNMMPLRFRDHCGDTFEQLLQHVRSVTHDALKHKRAPFEKIVQALDLDHAANHFPISQIALNYQVYGNQARIKGTDFEVVDINLEDMPTFCDMSLEMLEDPSTCLRFRLQYDSNLYGDADMERFLENFITFLSSTIKDHRQPIQEVSLCGQKELDYLREKCWNVDLNLDVWGGKSVVSKILELVETQPQATAIRTSDDESITYEDLLTQGKQIASRMQISNIRPGDIVGILFHPGIDMIAALIGAVLAGCGYTALDPSFATERLRHMMKDSSISTVLASPDLMALAGELYTGEINASILAVSSPESLSFTSMAPWPPPGLMTDSPFYVIYTSVSGVLRGCRREANMANFRQGKHGQAEGCCAYPSNNSGDAQHSQRYT